jgi:leucyl aminopeptidase
MFKMSGTVVSTPLAQVTTPLLAVALPQGGAVPPSLAELDRTVGEAVGRAIASGDFKGKRDETALLYPGGGKAERLLLVGLGNPGELTRSSVRRAAAVAAKRARALGRSAQQFAFAVAREGRNGVSARDLGQVVVEGAAQGAWAFTELKAAPDDPKPDVEGVVVVCDPEEAKDVAAGQRIGNAVAAGHALARYLQIQPGNVCTPSYLAERAKQLADAYGFTLATLDRAAMRKEGMGALLAVAQGSEQEPRFIVLEYRGAGDTAPSPPIALVGKGVTFDSGGISIKPAQSMEDMKFDMSGAAAVLGTFEVLGALKPKLNVVGLIPATENLPSGTAVKPGDVVKSHLGKTIEIINTDAEGRLILCDALSYVRRFKPAAVLDIATLTGAVVVALGQVAIGAMGNDDALVGEVREAGERAGERCWPLPLWDDYRDLLKSDIADIKNSGGRGAGTIAGGWFLREFVEGYPWVHLDIAGTAYTEGEGPHQAKGPTAVGVRLFTEFILKRAGA